MADEHIYTKNGIDQSHDIVTRLRDCLPPNPVGCVWCEAADEIERLREERDDWQEAWHQTFDELGEATDEIERLRAEVAAWRKDAHGLPPANTWRCPECGGTLEEATHTEDCVFWIGG